MLDFRSIYGGMLQAHTVSSIRELNAARAARIDALKTKEEAQGYVEEVRGKIAKIFAMPSDRSVPECEFAGTVEHDRFRIEKIIYYSREKFPVTANLYLPRSAGKHPAVLLLCGHGQEGKATDTYQAAAQNLALQGYVVLVPDPAGQGERWQFVNVPGGADVHGRCTWEHSMMGKQLRLCGDYFGAWRAYDALRGLDLLLSRPEVDPARVGITGNSGGGTMTTFVQALDPRFTMAAPSCYVTSWQRNWENEIAADAEQIPPGILAAGCEMGDFLLAYAPRPILLLGQKNDFFDARGLKETWEQARKVYKLLGAEENLQYFIGPTNHGYSVENREAMYRFFASYARPEGTPAEDPGTELLSEKELSCTETGQIMTSRPELSTIHDLIVRKAAELKAARRPLSPAELKARLRQALRIPAEIPVPYARILRPVYLSAIPAERACLSRFGLEGEPGLFTTLKLDARSAFMHFPALEKLNIYLPHLDAGSEVVQLDRDPEELYAGFDYRGTGESAPLTGTWGPDFRKFNMTHNHEYHFDSVALMFGSSMIGLRTLDTLRAVAFVKSSGVKHLHLAGRGLGAFPALMAALLADEVESLTLYDAPESYESMVQKYVTHWPQSCMIPGALEFTDLPELYAAVKAEKPLDIVNFVREPLPQL
ncbi:MAG: acetylxylan esterase [Lentisphaeria bacterium]|nr:acetylxylan esterase [Lentisphaeria bacterium]